MSSIIGDILCPLNAHALFLTDGPNAYGTAVVGTSAAMVYGDPPNNPTGTYTASALGDGGVTRPYISGHQNPANIPDLDKDYWRVPLDPTVLSAWDPNGDWLFIDSVAFDNVSPGGRGRYPEELWGISALPDPISAAPTPWLQFGIFIRSSPAGGGSYAGLEWAGLANTAKTVISGFSMEGLYHLSGHEIGDDSIGVYMMHKQGSVVNQYVAFPGAIYSIYGGEVSSYPSPGDVPASPILFSQRYGYGNNGMEDATRPLVSGLISGTLTQAQVQQISDAILSGAPVYVPPAQPAVLSNLHRASATCEGGQITLTWDAASGATGYEIVTTPAIGSGVARTAATTLTLTPAVIGISYTLQLRAYAGNCLGARTYSQPVTFLATPCQAITPITDCYDREPNPTTAYTRLPDGCGCE